METDNINKKIQRARDLIAEMKIQKQGRNTYSNFDYYTPDQITQMVSVATKEVGLITYFSLHKNELGYFGLLDVISLDSDSDHKEFVIYTEKPSITATNATQQVGGMVTFTERYCKMIAFDIVDDVLDFDDDKSKSTKVKITKPNKPLVSKKIPKTEQKVKKVSKKQYDSAIKKIQSKDITSGQINQLKAWLGGFGENKYKIDLLKLL
jgi:hypothetical protein